MGWQERFLKQGEELGIQTEKAFQAWLQRHDVPYWRVDQRVETFSPAFWELFARRIDFMVLLDVFGPLLFEVQHLAFRSEETDNVAINAPKVRKVLNVERLARIPVWFALGGAWEKWERWFFIPASKVPERGKYHSEGSEQGDDYYLVAKTEFVVVNTDKGLSALILPFYG